jgi:Radical SAM proteins, N-terminal
MVPCFLGAHASPSHAVGRSAFVPNQRVATARHHSANTWRRAAVTATLAAGIRDTTPSGTITRPEDWVNAERNEKLTDSAWAGLRTVLPNAVLRTLKSPGEWLGNELGAVNKSWDSAEVHFALAYPDQYEIGLSNSGHIILYSCINEADNLMCDRSYLPKPDMQAALEAAGKHLFAVESKRPLKDFDIVGMSISYELSATSCLKMMDLAGIPQTWAERDITATRFVDGPPLIFAGGLSVTANPEPYADFFDFFSLGDGEIMLPAFGQCVATQLRKNPDISRHDLVLALARDVPGCYAPRFYNMEPVYGSCKRNHPDVPARPERQNAMPEPWRAYALTPHAGAVHDRLSVEIRRGCSRGCRFVFKVNFCRLVLGVFFT